MFRERRRIHVINPKLSASRATADTHAQGELYARLLPVSGCSSFGVLPLDVLLCGFLLYWAIGEVEDVQQRQGQPHRKDENPVGRAC